MARLSEANETSPVSDLSHSDTQPLSRVVSPLIQQIDEEEAAKTLIELSQSPPRVIHHDASKPAPPGYITDSSDEEHESDSTIVPYPLAEERAEHDETAIRSSMFAPFLSMGYSSLSATSEVMRAYEEEYEGELITVYIDDPRIIAHCTADAHLSTSQRSLSPKPMSEGSDINEAMTRGTVLNLNYYHPDEEEVDAYDADISGLDITSSPAAATGSEDTAAGPPYPYTVQRSARSSSTASVASGDEGDMPVLRRFLPGASHDGATSDTAHGEETKTSVGEEPAVARTEKPNQSGESALYSSSISIDLWMAANDTDRGVVDAGSSGAAISGGSGSGGSRVDKDNAGSNGTVKPSLGALLLGTATCYVAARVLGGKWWAVVMSLAWFVRAVAVMNGEE